MSHVRAFAFLAVTVASTIVLEAHDARACTVIIPLTVLPGRVDAPRNAHVWIQGLPLALYGGATFALVRSTSGRGVSLDLRSWESSSMTWELVPREPLAPRERYEVWGAPRDGKPKAMLATFRTREDEDAIAPNPPAIVRAEARGSMVGCPPYLELEGTPGSEADGDVVHAIWMTSSRDRIDYTAPPKMLFVWPKPTADSPRPLAEISHDQQRNPAMRVGVRAVDVAGNMSAPFEIDVTVSKQRMR